MPCTYCVVCRWCHKRDVKKHMFVVRDGPIDRWFCDADCSVKWTEYRHHEAMAHVVKMSVQKRKEYLQGKTIDEFISNSMRVK
jgi:hypothetical protein